MAPIRALDSDGSKAFLEMDFFRISRICIKPASGSSAPIRDQVPDQITNKSSASYHSPSGALRFNLFLPETKWMTITVIIISPQIATVRKELTPSRFRPLEMI